MGLLSIFKKKKEEVIEHQLVDNCVSIAPSNSHECEFCKKEIGIERYSKRNGSYFHRKCFKNAIQIAKKRSLI